MNDRAEGMWRWECRDINDLTALKEVENRETSMEMRRVVMREKVKWVQ